MVRPGYCIYPCQTKYARTEDRQHHRTDRMAKSAHVGSADLVAARQTLKHENRVKSYHGVAGYFRIRCENAYAEIFLPYDQGVGSRTKPDAHQHAERHDAPAAVELARSL